MFFEGDSKSYMKYIDINGVVKASYMPCFSFFFTHFHPTAAVRTERRKILILWYCGNLAKRVLLQ